jgi:hypothetical protein
MTGTGLQGMEWDDNKPLLYKCALCIEIIEYVETPRRCAACDEPYDPQDRIGYITRRGRQDKE